MKHREVLVAPIAPKVVACLVRKEELSRRAVVDVVKGKKATSVNNLEQQPLAKAHVTTSCVS